MAGFETNTHFKIKTRPRHEGQYPRQFPHHQSHDSSQIPSTRGHNPLPHDESPESPHNPLRGHHPQQFPHHQDQDMQQMPPRQDKHSDRHAQQYPHFPGASHEHKPHDQGQQRFKPARPDYQGRHPHQQHLHQQSQGPRVPSPRKTKPLTWFLAVCCTIFWVVIILGGLIVLIIYLMYHPESPHFDISAFTLNTAYLDAGNLLNADVRILANFNNSNRKVSVAFSYLILDLYYGDTRIGTQYIEPFYEANSVSVNADIHMVTSELRLPFRDVQRLATQVQSNRVQFEVKGMFRTRSNLGSLIHYSYWLYSHCTVVVTSPPSGILLWKKCRTKRQ